MDKIINLSIARKGVPVFMDVVQGATAPNIVFVLDDYTPPGNARARIYIKKSNAEVYNSCTLSGNQITYTPTAGSFDEPGQCVAQLEIVQGNTVAISWRIFVTVEPNLIEGSAAPASTEYGALTDLIIDAQKYDVLIGANNIVGANNRQGWTALTSGQDLNTVTGVGVYYANTRAIARSLLNCPTDNYFRIDVLATANANGYVFQTIYDYSQYTNAGLEWVRFTEDNGTSWTEWELKPPRAEVNAIANAGAKNICPNTMSTQTVNGITFTKNADGTITMNGTATATLDFPICTPSIPIVAGQFILSGITGGSGATYRLYCRVATSSGNQYAQTDDGDVVIDKTGTLNRVYINVKSGTVLSDVVISPMIRNASIQDDTYVPYGMSNAELTKLVLQLLNA